MPLKNYQLVVGQPIAWMLDDDSDPHVEVLLDVAGVKFRAAVNVRSQDPPHTLMFKRIHPFEDAITAQLASLTAGVYDLKNSPLALDYVRDGMVRKNDMTELPYRSDGVANDLLDHLQPIVEEAIGADGTQFYVFGETWGPEATPDDYFHFVPGRGVHDIHMNQGSQGRFRSSNGIHQDGGILIRHADSSWTAIFLGFASQAWETDSQGHPTTGPVIEHPTSTTLPIRIVAALINPYNPEEGRETITLLNVSDKAANLDGWQLADGENRMESLSGYDIGAGDAVRVRLTGTNVRLKNKAGGRIKLVAPDQVVVQEIVYEKEDLKQEGWSVLF